ncbi:cobalt ABC transporter ATP-binding protein [Corynebacterium sp. 13CS0277]|uniref:energy-coupling factor ABC transporter ATP-binding protein n=1 Tax=Corynebacterium sp. 13CS0277 TaxID=2071994 RepID=UPI000D03C210|nr:ABC transporter ATP-binding protein [Corynebacterium sp. 13CS0277]PRQ10542.1 cobalt ABC transporter ATP-binding protein [Corynebacterium sp. 13CS0277]
MSKVVFDSVSYTPPQAERPILKDVAIELAERRVAIVGANGGGKSTFVRMINGLYAPSAGRVTVDGVDPQVDGKQVRRSVGFVFADADNQIIMPTVEEDVEFSLRRTVKDKKERAARAHAALERFHLAARATQSPHTLSGGQKQMLALASVCVMEPSLIIADEPTTLLDLRNRLHLRDVFDELEQTLYVVTHDLDFVSGFDRALCIDEGAIVADGEVDEVLRFYTRRMGGTA